jgi:hypothetical protein
VKKASLNLIDKAVAFLNPQGAVDRLVARQKLVNFSYDAVKYIGNAKARVRFQVRKIIAPTMTE